MASFKTCLIVGMALALPLSAFAQSAEAKYCMALASKWEEYVGRGQTPDASQSAAAAKCKNGDTSGIPVLEKALQDNKITLPPRT
jgi:hypothetical protein